MGKERRVLTPLPLPEIVAEPESPARLTIEDVLHQTVAFLAGMGALGPRLLKADAADRLLVCNAGQEANRVARTQILPAALPATVVFSAQMVSWAVTATAGGVEVDPQDALGVSYGSFTIPHQGVWEMHIPCAQVVLSACAWCAAPATHITVIEWRRV